MKKKILLFALVVLLAGCTVSRDRQRIEQAEALLYTNRDSAELLLRQVERPERLDEAHLAKYWFVTCDLHANSMQTVYQRKTQVRQKLGLQEGEDIAEKLG